MADIGGVDASIAGIANLSTITGLFDLKNMIPPYYIQIAIGLYLVQIVFILTKTLVTVDAGEDKLKTTYDTGRYLSRGILLYTIISFIAIFALGLLVTLTLGGLVG